MVLDDGKKQIVVVTSSLMKPLFLTNNPNLSSTSRILQSWLVLGEKHGMRGVVVGRAEGDLVEWMRGRGIPCLVDPMPWFDRRRPWEALWHAYRVARWAKTQGVDVIHCNEHDLYPFVMLLKRFLKRPVVCYVRYRLDRDFAKWCFAGKRRPDQLLWTSLQQKIDSFDAVADLIADADQQVVHLGIDLSQFGSDGERGLRFRREHGIADDEILLATASPLRPRKRVEDFIEVMRRLAPRHPKLVGIIGGGEIAGDEEYRVRIEREVRDSGLGRRLQWVGNLEPVEPLHSACDISISTSEYETFGNSVCEAMACGKPVVGYVGGSVAEVVGETGISVKTKDLSALVAAVECLVVDPTMRCFLGDKARERVRDVFNPEHGLLKVLAIYDSLLKPKVRSVK
ncbi:MAG TPA: hypothetical protein DDZ51_17875 [Planctomycetaceae bacterium]|nr:hypothetical protein [Planctomycetaceae bacterium]